MKTASKSVSNDKIQPMNLDTASSIAVRLGGGLTIAKGALLNEATATTAQNEVQTLTITATAGTYRLSWTGFGFTVALAFNAANAAVQAAIDTVLGVGNCVVTGASSPYTLTFGNEFANRDVEAPAIDTSALTFTVATLVETTKGAIGKVGSYTVYAASGTPKAVCARATKTDARGGIIDEFGNSNTLTTDAWNGGDFLCSEIPNIDAAAVTAMGKLVSGAAVTDAGAVLRIT